MTGSRSSRKVRFGFWDAWLTQLLAARLAATLAACAAANVAACASAF